MRERIRRNDRYEGIKMQSWPCASGMGSFKRRLMIFHPNGAINETIYEYVDKFVRGETDTKNFPYATLELCHKANFEWGREIINRWKQKSYLPSSIFQNSSVRRNFAR